MTTLATIATSVEKCFTSHSSLDVKKAPELIEFIHSTQVSGPSPSLVKKSSSGLERSVVFLSDDQIYVLLNSSRRGDQIIGRGACKTIKLAWDVLRAKEVVSYTLVNSEQAIREIEIRKAFSGQEGIQAGFLGEINYETSKGKFIRVFEPIYEGCLDKKIKALPSDEDFLNDSEKQVITKRLCTGLLTMHSSGFLHRDIKPENILISKNESGEAIADLADLGLCCHVDDKASQMIMQGSLKFFSPEYLEYAKAPLEMPPEFIELSAIADEKEGNLLKILSPDGRVKSINKFHVDKFIKTHPEAKESIEALYAELVDVRAKKAAVKPVKDFSTVTTYKHDVYALGLSIYALYTSQEALDAFLSARDKDINTPITFDGYAVPPAIMHVVTGMLQKDPAARMSLEEVLSSI